MLASGVRVVAVLLLASTLAAARTGASIRRTGANLGGRLNGAGLHRSAIAQDAQQAKGMKDLSWWKDDATSAPARQTKEAHDSVSPRSRDRAAQLESVYYNGSPCAVILLGR